MNRALGLVFLLGTAATAAAQAKADPKIDRLKLRKGNVLEGTITKETHKEIAIALATGGSSQVFAPSDVLKIEYGDAPEAFKRAMEDIEGSNWSDALSKINSAEESVDQKLVKAPRRWWFDPWVLYYRSLCLKETSRPGDAIKWLSKLIEKHKDARLLPDAYDLILGCYRDKGDLAGALEFMKEIEKAPDPIKAQLKKRAQKQQAEILLQQGKPEDAKPLFEQLAREADPDLKAEATAGVIRCLALSKNPADLVAYCEGVLRNQSSQPGLLLIASNALGDHHFKRRAWHEARDAFIAGAVRYPPPRGSALTREHDRALYQLARTYEALASEEKGDLARWYSKQAGRTYRELAQEYPSGRYRNEAVAKAARLDQEE